MPHQMKASYLSPHILSCQLGLEAKFHNSIHVLNASQHNRSGRCRSWRVRCLAMWDGCEKCLRSVVGARDTGVSTAYPESRSFPQGTLLFQVRNMPCLADCLVHTLFIRLLYLIGVHSVAETNMNAELFLENEASNLCNSFYKWLSLCPLHETEYTGIIL